MAEQWLEEIYAISKCISQLKQISQLCRVGNTFEALEIWDKSCSILVDLYNQLDASQEQIRRGYEQIYQKKDMVKCDKDLNDFVQGEVLPVMYQYVASMGQIDVSDGEYSLISSKTGYITLKDNNTGRFLLSTYDPMEEAYSIAQKIFRPEITEYYIWGAGMGYVAYQLNQLSIGSATIHIYEDNPTLLQYAIHYGVLEWIDERKLIIHDNPSRKDFLDTIDEKNNNYVVLKDDVFVDTSDNNSEIRRVALNSRFHMEENRHLLINYYSNIKQQNVNWWMEYSHKKDDIYIIVGAGPSLDLAMDYLKTQQRKKKIFVVGRAAEAIMKEGIVPDLIVNLETSPLAYNQFVNIIDECIPLLLSCYSYWKIAKQYSGRIYLAPTGDDLVIQKICDEKKMTPWVGGGTVSYLAIEAAIHFGAKEIELIGIDLAYPNGEVHAKATGDAHIADANNFFETDGVTNTRVCTDVAFDMYRKQIENLIMLNRQVVFTNLSPIGAKINGTLEKEMG